MATSKLTDRTELTAQPANDDVLHVVDVSDTTGSTDGTSKKIKVSNLMLAAGGGSGTTVTVRNNSGGTIDKGKAVYITGVVSDTPTIALASNASASTSPAVGVTTASIANNTDGTIIGFGVVENLDTSGFTPSATLYLSTLGNLTTTKPTGTALIQNMGTCLKVSASTGSILVEGAGRTNDVPNIPDGQAWVGNSSGVATPTTLADVATGGEITDLTDTPAALGTAGQVLQVNTGATAMEFADPVRDLDGLSDAAINSGTLADRQTLVYSASSSAFRNGSLNLADAADVDSTTPTNGQVLSYDSATSKWRPATGGGGGSTTVYSVKTFAFFDSTVRDVYIPMSSESETTSIQRYNRYMCMFDGQVDTISFIGTTNLSGGTGGTIVVRKITSGTNTPVTLETETFSSTTAYVTTTLTFSSSSAFSAGDVLVFRMTNGFGTAFSNVTGAIKFKLT